MAMAAQFTSKIVVRDAISADENQWREMWDGYCSFYEASVSADVTNSVWARILDKNESIYAVVAQDESGQTLGFANYILHPFTWGKGSACYLEDLFVKPAARGNGVGQSLIDELLRRGKDNQWARVYWMTASDNETARKLYDRYCSADSFVRYTVRI